MKNKLNLILFCLIIIAGPAEIRAQVSDTVWSIRLNGQASAYYTGLFHVIQTTDGHYLAAGTFYTDTTEKDAWVVKFNDKGEVLWNRTYYTDTTQPWIGESAHEIVETDDGKLVIFTTNTQYEHHLLFLNADGEQTNLIKYKDSEDPYYIFCGARASDIGFVVAGDHPVWDGNNWIHYSWYKKIDDSGNMIWEHSFPPTNGSWERFECIGKLPEGGYILAGSSDSPDNYDELLFVKTNIQGDTIWTKRWGTAVIDTPYEIVPVTGGGFIVAGQKAYDASYKGFLLKISDNGSEQWFETYNDYSNDEIFSVKPCRDGGYIATGSFKPYSASYTRLWVFKTDGQGRMVKSLFWGDEVQGYTGQSILQTEDGGYITVGTTFAGGIIVKISPSFGSLGIEDDPVRNNGGFFLGQNYPNPFNKCTTISWFQPTDAHVLLKVYDFTGREVKTLVDCEMVKGKHQVTFDGSGLPEGVYFVGANASNIFLTKKIVKL